MRYVNNTSITTSGGKRPLENYWETRTVSLGWLRRQAWQHREMTNVFDWLKAIGLVPESVTTRKVAKPRLDCDPDALNVGYLASTAFEWDSWGESSPTDFVNAIAAEAKGDQRDYIAAILTMLGREQTTMEAAA